MNRRILHTILLAVCSLSLVARALDPLPADMHEIALASIKKVYNEDFEGAEAEAKRLIKAHPEHPAGYFFYAAVLDAIMEYYQDSRHEVEFYRYCDLAASKGENYLESKPNDVWAKFFLAGAHGAKGTYESRYERWITAFRYGWQGVSLLKELTENVPELVDNEMGIATYDYWRSAMTKAMWWMPGVEDKREPSIKKLQEIWEKGVYVKEAAAKHLVSILNNEKRYKECVSVADEMLARFPNCLVFLWAKAEANFGRGRYQQAEREYKHILGRVKKDKSGYNVVMCHYYLANIYFAQERYSLCRYECDKASSYPLDDATKKRLEKRLAEVGSLMKKSKSAEKKSIKDLIQ